MKKIVFVLFMLAIIFAAGNVSLHAEGTYSIIKLDGSVNPIIADHIINSIQKANDEGAQFIVLQMDTPGGLMTAMRDIIKEILASEIPVIVYTYPRGAQAASAGAYIMLASHYAVMAPGTEIGAMHPVSPMLNFSQEKKDKGDDIMEKKVLNDTIAYARSLAQMRGRNVDWTVKAVKDAISSTNVEAYRLGVIDMIATDMQDLMAKLDGKKISINNEKVKLSTTGLSVLEYPMNWQQKMLNYFADPQVVFLLFIIGVAGIGFELKNPGMIFPGVAGAISLFIFLMAVRVLPINVAGIVLILLAIILFILELQIVSYGLLTVAGMVAFVIGSTILFDSPLPGGRVPMTQIIAVLGFVLLFVFVLVRAVLNVHSERITTGTEGMRGEKGVALKDFAPGGKVQVHGEIWNAESDDEIHKGDRVVVEKVEGMLVYVKKMS